MGIRIGIDIGTVSAKLAAIGPAERIEALAGDGVAQLGEVFPNPAIMRNTCHTILVENCVLKHPTQLDQGEDLVTRLIPIDSIPELMASGRIRHCLVVTALYYFDLWRRDKWPA